MRRICFAICSLTGLSVHANELDEEFDAVAMLQKVKKEKTNTTVEDLRMQLLKRGFHQVSTEGDTTETVLSKKGPKVKEIDGVELESVANKKTIPEICRHHDFTDAFTGVSRRRTCTTLRADGGYSTYDPTKDYSTANAANDADTSGSDASGADSAGTSGSGSDDTAVGGGNTPSTNANSFQTDNFAASSVASSITGNTFQQRTNLEKLIFEKIVAKRKEGFVCPDGTSFPAVVDTAKDLLFDCRLWWSALYHSEDMTKGGFYAHVSPGTTYAGGSPTGEEFQARTARVAWNMGANVENIYRSYCSGCSDDVHAEQVVAAWLASNSHCIGMGQSYSQLFGVAGVACDTADPNQKCVGANANDPSVDVYWYWTSLYTYQHPAVPATIGVQDYGIDDSCY